LLNDDSLMSAADSAIDNDLFRSDRAAPLPAATVAAPTAAPKPAPPKLVLRGIVGGPPWDVIIDGLPGHAAGAVVRDGESVSGILVHVATRDTVHVRGMDSSWTLVFQRR
jgi:hypothetical protein